MKPIHKNHLHDGGNVRINKGSMVTLRREVIAEIKEHSGKDISKLDGRKARVVDIGWGGYILDGPLYGFNTWGRNALLVVNHD